MQIKTSNKNCIIWPKWKGNTKQRRYMYMCRWFTSQEKLTQQNKYVTIKIKKKTEGHSSGWLIICG